MIYLKSILVGMACALAVAVLTVVAGFLMLLPAMPRSIEGGSGGLGAVSAPLYGFPYLSVLGFVLGFWWQFRRSRRRARA